MMDSDKLIDILKPGSGCSLLESFKGDIAVFLGLVEMARQDICIGCYWNYNNTPTCEFMKKRAHEKKAEKIANFNKVTHVTNAELAAEKGLSKRQIAKMRKRGEL